MGLLLRRQFDVRGLLVADADVQSAAFGGDGEVAVAEATDEIERFSSGLLVREAHRVGRDIFLDGGAHVRRGTEEAIRRDEAFERLVRTLEVVGVDEDPVLDGVPATSRCEEHVDGITAEKHATVRHSRLQTELSR
jgi:hypothetical protein